MASSSLPHFLVVNAIVHPEHVSWAQLFLQLPKAWGKSRGAGQLVGIVDTGIAVDHPDLIHAIVDSRDFAGSHSGVVDEVGHGTHVAGIIAARDDHHGIVGIAPDAGILNAKVLRRPGAPIAEEDAAAAILWCAERGARIINMSLSWDTPVPAIRNAVRVAEQRFGAIVTCSAGNRGGSGGPVGYPARYPETLSTGYVHLGHDGVPHATPDSAAGAELDVVAPGGEIMSTFPPNIYAVATGTSMAAAFVSGVLALLFSHYSKRNRPLPDLKRVRALIRGTARDLYPRGADRYTGWGLIEPVTLLDND